MTAGSQGSTILHYDSTLTTSEALIGNLLLMCCGMLQVLCDREAQGVAGPQAGKGPPRGRCSAPGRAACGAAARRRQSVRGTVMCAEHVGVLRLASKPHWAANGASSLGLPKCKSMAFLSRVFKGTKAGIWDPKRRQWCRQLKSFPLGIQKTPFGNVSRVLRLAYRCQRGWPTVFAIGRSSMSAWECEQGVAAGSWLPEWAAFGAADMVAARRSGMATWGGEQEAVKALNWHCGWERRRDFRCDGVHWALQGNCSTPKGMKLW